jgi:hypothetical protein
MRAITAQIPEPGRKSFGSMINHLVHFAKTSS